MMIPRILACALAFPALVIAPHLLRAMTAAVTLAVQLGPHNLIVIAFAATLAVALIGLWRIDALTMKTGWGVVPVRKVKAALA